MDMDIPFPLMWIKGEEEARRVELGDRDPASMHVPWVLFLALH